VREIEIVQRLLGVEQSIVIFSYFMTNAIYKERGVLAVAFPRKKLCNVLIELFLLYVPSSKKNLVLVD